MSGDDRFAEQVALATFGFIRDEAPHLLCSLAEPVAGSSLQTAKTFAALSTMDRRAQMTREFGYRRDANLRLRRVFGESTHELRRAMYQCLPPFFRSMFPELKETVGPGRAPVLPALSQMAARRVREALL